MNAPEIMNNTLKVAEVSTSMRNVIAMPNTASARANDHMLRSHTAAVGYNTVAAAASIGSDKTQVCRFFTGERPVTLPQLLHWMDTAGIRFEAADENSEEGVLQDLIDQASISLQGIEQRKSDLSVDEVEALLKVAKLYIASRMKGAM